jgi:hypothetical protein
MTNYFDIGYPDRFGSCHIGLFQPILRRFLLTVCDVRHAQEIIMIASNRYTLYSVNLVTANNYCQNLIDNHCCDSWGVNQSQILSTADNTYADFFVDAQQLVPQSAHYFDVATEKNYLQMIYYYVKLLEDVSFRNLYAPKVKQFMLDTFDHQEKKFTGVQNLKKQITKELYLSQNMNSTHDAIVNIISNIKQEYDIIF